MVIQAWEPLLKGKETACWALWCGDGESERGNSNIARIASLGIPGWRSGLAPAFGPGRDPGDPGSNPTSGSWCMEPASPSACVSASLSLCDYHK